MQRVRQPTGTKDQQTTVSVATTTSPEPRALLKAAFLTILAEAEKTAGKHRLRDGPKDAEKHPASTPLDLDLVRCREEDWYGIRQSGEQI